MDYLFVISVLVASTSAAYFRNETYPNGTIPYNDEPSWTKVSATWCPDPTMGSFCFEEMPLTAYQAIDEGWELVDDDCENNGRWYGYRYVYDRDWSLVLLYDKYGIISGIQTHMLIEELVSCYAHSEFRYHFKYVPYFLKTRYDGKDYYTLTMYIQNPRTICESGRSLPEYYEEGLGGYGVWLQNGDNPYATEFVPGYRPGAVEKHWENAQCVNAMGHHNFKNMHTWDDNNCGTMEPWSCLYDNDDYLRTVAFMVMGNATSKTNRFEKLPAEAVKWVMNGENAPSCVFDFIKECTMTTMHIYFTRETSSFVCKP